MVATISDAVKKNLRRREQPEITDTTRRVEELRRGQTGREVDNRGRTRSRQAQRAAATETRGKLDTLTERGELAAADIEGKQATLAQGERQSQQQEELAREQMRIEAGMRASDILGNLSRGQQEISYERHQDKIEEAGFLATLADDKYVFNLQMEGNRRRLTKNINFLEALQKSIFAEEIDLLEDNIQFQEIIDAKGRRFNEKLATIDINTALAVASSEAKSQEIAARWGGVEQAIQGGAKAWSNMDEPKTSTQKVK